MPEPQPGTDRPADGSTSAPGREPGTDESAGTPVPPATEPTANAPAEPTSGSETSTGPTDADRTTGEPLPEAGPPAESPVAPARGSAPVPANPSGPAATPPQPAGPGPTRVETDPQPPAPRWSGSAPVPPPPPRKRSWGESAEPTPAPSADSPEHMVPVDPWEGVDTTGWDLHSADFPALPPALPYSPPAHTLPYPPPPVTPPPPAAATPVSPPPAAPTPVPPPPYAPAPPVAAGPVPPPRTAPPAPARPPKQRRATPAPPTPPPGWQPPKGYVAVPVRRRRRWPWALLLAVACCCGVPLWWTQSFRAQYPASATLPDQVAGLRLRQDERSQAAAEKLKNEVRQAYADDAFGGIYTTNEGKRVTLFGGTGLRLTPEADADAEMDRLKDRYALGPAEAVETGVRGRYERCAVGREDRDAVVVCTSVDHGSLVTGVFTRLDVNDSGRLLDQLRQQVVTADRP